MAEGQTPADFGHKVIFLNPDFPGHGDVFKDLRENEYEFYLLENYRDAKSVLREYKSSICIIYADDGTTKRKVINFILSCSKDDSVNSTLFYLLTSELVSKEKKALEQAQNCYHGMIALNSRTPFMIQAIKQQLEDKNAKGRRQYVRVSCSADREAIALAEINGRLSVEAKLASVFPKGTVIPSVNFTLGGKQIPVGEVAVYAVFPMNNEAKLVLLFKNPLIGERKELVHNYIREKFDSDINTIIKSRPRDEEDYSKAFAEGESDAQ